MPPTKTTPSGTSYEIAPSLVHKIYPPEAAEKARPKEPHEAEASEGKDAAGAEEKRAIWIVHGMGQQIPFETLDSITEGLISVGTAHGNQGIRPRYRTVRIGDQVAQRVELDVKNGEGKKLELHLYEAYWAPRTEGVIHLRETIAFLFGGGWRGLLNSLKTFERAMFGEMATFPRRWRSVIEILLVLAILLSLVVINAVIVGAGAANYNLPGARSVIDPNAWGGLTAAASALTSVALTFAVILFLAVVCKPPVLQAREMFQAYVNRRPGGRTTSVLSLLSRILQAVWKFRTITVLSWLGFLGTALWVVYTGLCLSLILWSNEKMLDWLPGWLRGTIAALLKSPGFRSFLLLDLPPRQLQGFSTALVLGCVLLFVLALLFRRVTSSLRKTVWITVPFFVACFALHLTALFSPFVQRYWARRFPGFFAFLDSWFGAPGWVWPFLIVFGYLVRTLIVQYVGDVAIYVTHNQLDRFDKLRQEIKGIALKSATAVYRAANDAANGFEYSKIAVAGHSLGSVIAYDTLNRLLTEDSLLNGRLEVTDRTAAFITFGSPLDKIAFFFTNRGKSSAHTRERLAATVQPLIQSYSKFRKFPWINVYSRNDVICGSLELFDLPPDGRPANALAVENLRDPYASVPLVAHVQYWQNPLVWELLYRKITA